MKNISWNRKTGQYECDNTGQLVFVKQRYYGPPKHEPYSINLTEMKQRLERIKAVVRAGKDGTK